MADRLCVALAFADQEAWLPVGPGDPFPHDRINDACVYLAALDPDLRNWRGVDPLQLETWPEIAEDYARRFGWAA